MVVLLAACVRLRSYLEEILVKSPNLAACVRLRRRKSKDTAEAEPLAACVRLRSEIVESPS